MPAAAIAAALEAEDPSTISGAVPRAFRAFADSTGADRFALAAIQRAGLAPAPDLSSVGVPVLVIAGDRDDLVGDPAVLAAAIPGARHVTVSGDHLSAVYDPRFAAEVVAFLDEVRASA
jgi:pimeloyl-ACP methyl ester carboxylesterase